MYNKINITENHMQMLLLFTNGFCKEYYIREAQRLLKISPRTAQLILNDLETKSVLESTTKGKIKSYKLKKSDISKEYLTLVEHYKNIAFLESHPLVREVIVKMTPFINGIGIIFGSYAKEVEKEDSDLDIFIAGNYDLEEMKKISERYGIEINIKNYPLKLFEKNIKNDVLIKEVLDNHIIFLNSEQLIRLVVENG